MRCANSDESCIRSKGALGRLISEGVVVLSKVFDGPVNVPTTPCRRQHNDTYNSRYITSGFFNSTLQIVTIEQDELNVRADVLPQELLRFCVDQNRDYKFTFRCRGIGYSQS